MEVQKYHTSCQTAVHFGLKLAKKLRHKECEVEHVCLGLLTSQEAPLDLTQQKGLSDKLYSWLQQQPSVNSIKNIVFGHRLKLVFRELEAQNSQEIRTRHFWSVLVRQSTVMRTMLAGGDPTYQVWEPPELTLEPPESSPAKSAEVTQNQVLDRYTVDLTAKALCGELEAVFGREDEIHQLIEVLSRRTKNNPMLVGEPGVGKTAVVEALALAITQGHVPETLRSARVLSLDIAGLLAGTRYRGDFEQRLKELIEAMQESNGRVFLFIDEVHIIMGAGHTEGGADAANLLKPALARGDFICIGATTQAEYRKIIRRDRALDRRFHKIEIMEPSPEMALMILRAMQPRLEVFHGIKIHDAALELAVELSVKHLPQLRLPDKAIDLIDEACARVKVALATLPRELNILRAKLQNLEIERRQLAERQGRHKAKARLEVEVHKVRHELNSLMEAWQHYQQLCNQLQKSEAVFADTKQLESQGLDSGAYEFVAQLHTQELPASEQKVITLTQEIESLERRYPFLSRAVEAVVVSKVVAERCGYQVSGEVAQRSDLVARLQTHVVGQLHALQALERAIRRTELGMAEQGQPIGVFLFTGPTGVGKTETAKALALEYLGHKNAFIRIDMSEYMQAHQVARLIGSPPGYVGFQEGGQLTEAVMKQPHAVVLFDEVEKAHPQVFDLFLQLFDEGRLTDSKGEVVDFSQCILIMTSNIQTGQESGKSEAFAREALGAIFRREFVNRIDEVIGFTPLTEQDMIQLTEQQLVKLNHKLEKRGLRLSLDSTLKWQLAQEATRSQLGVRALQRSFQAKVVDALTSWLLEQAASPPQGAWHLAYDGEGLPQWRLDHSSQLYLPASGS